MEEKPDSSAKLGGAYVDQERKPDLVLKGGRVYILNPEALPIALKNTALLVYKMYRNGEWIIPERKEREVKEGA
jgi:hypothetical protein